MPALKILLRHVFGSENLRYECRNCGTSLEKEAEHCPECDGTDIATYKLG